MAKRAITATPARAALLCLMMIGAPLPAQPLRIDGDVFSLNGKPYQILSGEMHYPRVPREYWSHRLRLARAMGLNTICTYLFWNLHEPEEGRFIFTGNLDVAEYARLAQQAGLNVILRPGPYVCAEWDFGGLPAWLLKDDGIRVRCMHPRFIAATRAYLLRLGEELRSLQITGGGPIILVQLENEYGSYGSDQEYLQNLRYQNAPAPGVPVFYRGTFQLDKTGDTFLDLKAWKKGAAWINGHQLGRYWRAGPQHDLFVPGVWLNKGENVLVVFDLEQENPAPLRATRDRELP